MNQKSVLEQIAETDPSLRSAYDEEIAYWLPDNPPATTLAGQLADALAKHWSEIPTEAQSQIFVLCETVMRDGSAPDAEVIATGFLEGFQHADGLGEFDFRQIVPHLGERSRAHCVMMDQFHGASTRGLT